MAALLADELSNDLRQLITSLNPKSRNSSVEMTCWKFWRAKRWLFECSSRQLWASEVKGKGKKCKLIFSLQRCKSHRTTLFLSFLAPLTVAYQWNSSVAATRTPLIEFLSQSFHSKQFDLLNAANNTTANQSRTCHCDHETEGIVG